MNFRWFPPEEIVRGMIIGDNEERSETGYLLRMREEGGFFLSFHMLT